MNYNLFKKLNSNQYLIFAFVISIYLFLLFSNLIHYLVWTKFSGGEYLVFFDWQTMIFFNQCHANAVDVYSLKACDKKIFPYPMIWGYGPSFLWLPLPYFEKLNFFYLKLIPIILIFLFVYLVIRVINPKSKIGLFLTLFALISPSTIQLVEKFNFDLIIFITTILIIFSNTKIINSILILITASVKFYPIFLLYNFFFLKEKFNKIFSYILIISIIFILYFYINIEDIKKIFDSDMLKNIPVGAKNFYIFAINDYLIDRKNNVFELLNFEYLMNIYKIIEFKFVNLILFIIFVISFINISLKKKILKINIFEIKSKLFMIGSTILIIAYFLHPNLYYREIFIILLIPLLISMHETYKGIFTYAIYFLLVKYLLDFMVIISDNNLFNSDMVTGLINIFLPLMDFVFVSFIFSLYLIFNYILLNFYSLDH